MNYSLDFDDNIDYINTDCKKKNASEVDTIFVEPHLMFFHLACD